MDRKDVPMDVTEDHILDHRVRLRQPKQGYRAGMDAVFLAASVPAKAGDILLDLGTGVGAVALAVLARVLNCTVVGLEREVEIATLARENAVLNDCQERFEITTGAIPDIIFDQTYDAVFANPPYYPEHAHTAAAAGYKRSAHVQEAQAPIAAWVATAARAVKPGGTVTFIYPARQKTVIRSLFAEHFQQMSILELRSHETSPEALRVIIQGQNIPGASPGHFDLEPFILHTAGRTNTHAAEAVLRGAAPTPLGIGGLHGGHPLD